MAMRSRAALICLLTAAAGLVVPRNAAMARDSVTFQANWLIQGENAYMVAGREKGFYAEEGIDITLNRGFGSGDTIKKIATSAADIGTADVGVLMLSRLREGLPVRCISTEYTYSPQGVWALESGPIHGIADLAGKRFGITPGNSLSVYFPLLAEANKLDMNTVHFINMEASALLPTLLAGQIDAMPGFATNFDLRNDAARAQGKPMHDFALAENGVRVYGECQIVTERTIATKPDLLRRYLRATRHALEWSRDHPEETAHLISASYPELDEKAVLVNHKSYMDYVFNAQSAKTGIGGFDTHQLQVTLDAVRKAQGITETIDLNTIVDASFLPPK
jgi:NitT/TauT family transport system substrate-binding protein